MTVLMIAAFAVFLLIIFIKPKWGSFLIWPILFTYPHGWWSTQGFLPLGAGADDVFFVFLFLVVFVRRNLMEGVPFRFGYAFWTISGFLFIALVATFFGSREAASFERIMYVRDMLKLASFWCLFYAVIHCIDNEYDLRRQLFAFSLAALFGAIVVIVHNFYPQRLDWFLAPVVLRRMAEGTTRASGAFMNPNAAAGTLACSVALIIAAMRLSRQTVTKLLMFGAIFVTFIAILLTRSRSGFLALSAVLALMAVKGKYKKIGWTFIIAGILIGALFSGGRSLLQERFARLYDPTMGVWDANVEGRFSTWSRYFETASAKDYLVGQGPRQGREKNYMETHSAYVSLITVYGLGSLVWAMTAILVFLKKHRDLKHFPDPTIEVLSSACLWVVLAWGIYALFLDALSSYYPRYMLFFAVVMLDRTYDMACRQSNELAYIEYINTSHQFVTEDTVDVTCA